jgi:hypothetical protein
MSSMTSHRVRTPKGDFFPQFPVHFRTILPSPPTRFFSFSKISTSKERKLEKYNFIYLGFIKFKDIPGVCRIFFRNQAHIRVIQDQLFFKDIPGIPGAVRTLSHHPFLVVEVNKAL